MLSEPVGSKVLDKVIEFRDRMAGDTTGSLAMGVLCLEGLFLCEVDASRRQLGG